MEDLSDHQILRVALIALKTFPRFAEDITTFMVNTTLLTTDAVMNHKKKIELVGQFIITEDLVYSEQFTDYNNRNELFAPNAKWVKTEIYQDVQLLLEAAKLKFEFMTNAQALIHFNRESGLLAISPSGIEYEHMQQEQVVELDLDHNVVDGNCKPSNELDMHSIFINKEKTSMQWFTPTPRMQQSLLH